MPYPMLEHRQFRWGFNVDGKLHLYHPWNVQIKDKLQVRNWASELNTEYPTARLMTDEMRKYTVWFFETYQRQRAALIDNRNHPLEMFLPYQKPAQEKKRNITNCYISLPARFCETKHKYCPLIPVLDNSYSPSILPPRFNIKNYGNYC
nr:uncharacterized protein LOC106690661 [Halyomorpha halys]